MLCEYSHTKSESLAQICTIMAQIQHFFLGDWFLLAHPVYSGGRAIWSILHEAASRGPSVLADIFVELLPFLPRDSYAKHGICRRHVSVCMCVSVTLRYCIKTAKHRITQIMPHDSPLTLVFWHQSSLRNSKSITPNGGDKCRWGGLKFVTFDKKLRYKSKTVQDRRIVSIKIKQEVVCALSNGYVSDDLGWPVTPQTTPIFAFFIAFRIIVVTKRRDFIFGVQVDGS